MVTESPWGPGLWGPLSKICSCLLVAKILTFLAPGPEAARVQQGQGGDLGLVFLWSLVKTVLGAESPWLPPWNPGGVHHQSIFLSFCFDKKIVIFPCPFFWSLMMVSPPPPGPRGQGCRGGEGIGAGQWWAGCLQASGHALYWMPRKRHMAKIMAKSSMASTPMARAPAR